MTTASTHGATQTTGATISEPVFTTHTVITGTVITTVIESTTIGTKYTPIESYCSINYYGVYQGSL